jgi:hypothetical protein
MVISGRTGEYVIKHFFNCPQNTPIWTLFSIAWIGAVVQQNVSVPPVLLVVDSLTTVNCELEDNNYVGIIEWRIIPAIRPWHEHKY